MVVFRLGQTMDEVVCYSFGGVEEDGIFGPPVCLGEAEDAPSLASDLVS